MPSRKIDKNCSKRKTHTSNTSTRRQRRGWGCRNKISSGQLKDLNEMIYNYKSKRSWKVVPKDSLEVHKDRRKRQIDDERKKEDNKTDENNPDPKKENNKDRRTSRRITRRRKRYNSRQQDSESSSSCSTLTCCTSCANRMDYE